jgi:hypothetical protein
MPESLRGAAPDGVVDLAAGHRNVQRVMVGAYALGSVTFAGNLSAGDTITLNGVIFEAVASGAAGTQFNIGVDLPTTLGNMVSVINAELDGADVTSNGVDTLAIVADIGSAGNNITLAASVGTVSGPTLTGGVDADTFDLVHNSAFELVVEQDAVFIEDITLPDGIEIGQEIIVYVSELPVGVSVGVQGSFSTGLEITLSDDYGFFRVMWTGAKWLILGTSN